MKGRPTFQDSVYVYSPTVGDHGHNPVLNPHRGWAWMWKGEGEGGFKRKKDAMRAAEKRFGVITWDAGSMRGYFGPKFTAEEWLARQETP